VYILDIPYFSRSSVTIASYFGEIKVAESPKIGPYGLKIQKTYSMFKITLCEAIL